MINLFSKTDDFIKMISYLVNQMHLLKMIDLFNKTDDFIKTDKFI